jgi:hypothetical protein
VLNAATHCPDVSGPGPAQTSAEQIPKMEIALFATVSATRLAISNGGPPEINTVAAEHESNPRSV